MQVWVFSLSTWHSVVVVHHINVDSIKLQAFPGVVLKHHVVLCGLRLTEKASNVPETFKGHSSFNSINFFCTMLPDSIRYLSHS